MITQGDPPINSSHLIQVSLQIVGFFYQQLKKTSPYSKDDDEGVDRTANPKHVAIMCALKVMLLSCALSR